MAQPLTPAPVPSSADGLPGQDHVPVVSLRGLWKQFGEKPVLKGISLDVSAGEIHVIMGPSGCGKSVTLKHMTGLLRPTRGEIHVFGRPVHSATEEELDDLRLRLGMVFQSSALFDSMSVAENVAFPMRRHRRLPDAEIRDRVRDLLDKVEMEGTEALVPADLSGGMRKRVGIARALALEPSLVLYDEPVSGLDPITARTVDALIARLRAALGVTSVVVTHNVESAFRLADRVTLLDDGEVVVSGTPKQVLASRHPFVQKFLEGEVHEGREA